MFIKFRQSTCLKGREFVVIKEFKSSRKCSSNSNEQFLIRKNTYEWFAVFRVMFMKKEKKQSSEGNNKRTDI